MTHNDIPRQSALTAAGTAPEGTEPGTAELDPSPHDSHELTAPTIQGAADLSAAIAQQDADINQYAVDFLTKVVRLRGVQIERSSFLHQELRKLGLSNETISNAVETTPIQAGISLEQLDELARAATRFETNKSASMSFISGIPGGFAMAATIPADVMQYYAHAFRIMQKLAYLYGWQDFLNDLEEGDDETLGKLTLFLGVMMGVAGASAGLTNFATQVARPALQKQIAKQALTKTSWYPVTKKVLAMVGVKITKDSFAKGVTKFVPLAGGVISGGMTLVLLRQQSDRLHNHLRTLPPPGMDAAEFRALTGDGGTEDPASGTEDGSSHAVEQSS